MKNAVGMKFAIEKDCILKLTLRQLDHLFVATQSDISVIERYFEQTIARVEKCFVKSTNKYCIKDGEAFFNPYHSVQYMIYLYYLSNTIYRNEPEQTLTCDKIYYLNKVLNAVDIFYVVELPDYFMAEHPVGTVIGKAEMDEGLLIYQNCTIGGFHLQGNNVVYPKIGKNVHIFAGASVIGDSTIGDNVNIGAGAIIKNQDVPSNSNVFGVSPNLIIKHRK